MRTDLNIVFWGSPHVAKEILESLDNKEFNITGVVSQPARPFGRKRIMTETPVAQYALDNDIPCITPELMDDEMAEQLRSWTPDVFVVIAYGRIIPMEILLIPRLVPINVHYSLLPRFRGASPITFALWNGQEETGITLIEMNEKLDSGDILFQKSIKIHPEESYSQLEMRLTDLAKNALHSTLLKLEDYIECRVSQDHSQCCYTTLLDREDGRINWLKPATEIVNHIRAFSDWPVAFSFLAGREIKFIHSTVCKTEGDFFPGQILSLSKDHFEVGTGKGSIAVHEVKPFGKAAMAARDFINGKNIDIGDILTMTDPAKRSEIPQLEGCEIFDRITLHHTNTFNDSRKSDEEIIRQVTALHLKRGWDSIGYHFLIGRDGKIFKGRFPVDPGAHVKGENQGNLGIALIGDFDLDLPSARQIDSLLTLVRNLKERATIKGIFSHGELAKSRRTSCPGALTDVLMRYINAPL